MRCARRGAGSSGSARSSARTRGRAGWTRGGRSPWRGRKRLRALVRKDAVERELDEEMAFHLEQETQKLVRAGVAPDEARRRARVAFGGVERNKEAGRGGPWRPRAPGPH